MEIGIITLIIFGIICFIFATYGFQGSLNKKKSVQEIMKIHGFDPKFLFEWRIILEWVDSNGNSLKNKVFNLMFSSDWKYIAFQYHDFFDLEALKKYSLNDVALNISNRKGFSINAAMGAGLLFGATAGIVAGAALPKDISYMEVKTPNEIFIFRLEPKDIEIFRILSLHFNNFIF